jgi:hypothetical protein
LLLLTRVTVTAGIVQLAFVITPVSMTGGPDAESGTELFWPFFAGGGCFDLMK